MRRWLALVLIWAVTGCGVGPPVAQPGAGLAENTPGVTVEATPAPSDVTPPAAETTPAATEVIIDNRDPGFGPSGHWFIGDGGQSYAGDCAWAPRGTQNLGYVNAHLPAAGLYEVYGWWCGDPHHDQTQAARIEIYPVQGRIVPWQVTVNLQENAGRWNSLGVYTLQDTAGLVVIGSMNGNVVADAFRFVYRGPDAAEVTPTPLPTPFPWTNHPPSPLEQVTAGDLSARLGLVQPFLTYTSLVAVEPAVLDDCATFPHEGCSGTREGQRVTVQYEDLFVPYAVSSDYRWVALDAPPELAARQLLYLTGSQGEDVFTVYHYAQDDTWHLYAGPAGSSQAYRPLSADEAARVIALATTYGPVSYTTPEGIELRLFGFGKMAALSGPDQAELDALVRELLAGMSDG